MQYKDAVKDAVTEIKSRLSFTRFFPNIGSGRRKNQHCPFHGKDAHPSLSISEEKKAFNCFTCHQHGDIIHFFALREGISDGEAIKRLAAEMGITIDRTADKADTRRASAAANFADVPTQPSANQPPASAKTEDAAAPLSSLLAEEKAESDAEPLELTEADKEYYREFAREQLADPDAGQDAAQYLARRGISIQTATAAGLGYDADADPAAAPFGYGDLKHPTPRLITFFDNGFYVGRAINPATPKQYQKMNCKSGNAGLFNSYLITQGDGGSVFIAEGIFDALSLLELGYKALSLNSASNTKLIIEAAKKAIAASDAAIKQRQPIPPLPTLIICLDADKAGIDATNELAAELGKIGVNYIIADYLNGSGKDINDRLREDRAGLEADARRAIAEAEAAKESRADGLTLYLEGQFDRDIDFLKDVIPTGFSNLDAFLDGGLSCGLYAIAAQPSLGKSTFCLQMADNIATNGGDVLYFTLEETRHFYAAKCISRRTRQAANSPDDPRAIYNSKIRKGDKSIATLEAIERLKKDVGNRLNIIEGNFGISTDDIRKAAEDYTRRHAARPVIFVDYLQILDATPDAANKYKGTREIVDLAIRELKQLSRELGIVIIAVVSLNRQNYAAEMDFTAIKESGGIEYTCDGIFGLQLQLVQADNYEKLKDNQKRRVTAIAKRMTPRKLDLVCLKNRSGQPTTLIPFNYEPAFDYFYPCSEFDRDNGTDPAYTTSTQAATSEGESSVKEWGRGAKKSKAKKNSLEDGGIFGGGETIAASKIPL